MKNKEDFAKYSYKELMEIYDNNEEFVNENSFAINGGEFYIGNIETIEEI